jgi:C-terminal processing protease CtpA/Prc
VPTGSGFVGVRLENAPDGVRISEILPSSPADAAGLKIGDVIVSIDGAPLDRIPPNDMLRINEASAKLQGQPNETVDLIVKRGSISVPYTLTRTTLTPSQPAEQGVIGLKLADDTDGVRVIVVLPSSPALAAGIMPGDLIVSIDDIPTVGMDYVEASGRIRGPVGRLVVLTILRNGSVQNMTVVRGGSR